MDEKHTCPRRIENFNREEGQDTWRTGTSLAGHTDDARLRSCSYCGSVHPDDFMAKVREGWFVVPTDKNYKAYVGEPIEPQEIGDPEVNALKKARGEAPMTIDHRDVGKFYYQHLSAEQRHEFIELYNAKTMKLGEPGRFYVRPFFATVVPSA